MAAALTRAVVGRHPVLLPVEAVDERAITAVETTYRLEKPALRMAIREPGSGSIACELVGYEGHFPRRTLWRSATVPYAGPCEFHFDLETGEVMLNGSTLGRIDASQVGRRFCWLLEVSVGGRTARRLTSHYRVGNGRPVGSDYYNGDHYVDYESESTGERARVLALAREHGAQSPILEIGSATGALTADLIAAGFDAYGVDASAWAVAEARRRLPKDRVFECRVGDEAWPAELMAHAPFQTIVLWAVLEHFDDPFAVVTGLTALAAPDALLFINTSNADSLTHGVFGRDWEGFVDWTHHGVEQVTPTRLRSELTRLGWRIVSLTTDGIWTANAGPTAATLRQWWSEDARFRRLLSERDLGDFVTCVARKAAA